MRLNSTPRPTDTLTLRLPVEMIEQVRTIARREVERESVVLRRLIRAGLEREQRGGEAA